ncbi:hypothetical protein BC830DRAFT_1171057 [Chytriomyces sp. MP71]|nr:hypothetical protein BC830DRAFT_1171057 [Chytriomyces sp. MP71]
MNFSIHASSSYSDFHQHQQLLQRQHQQIRQPRIASVIQSSLRLSSSPTDLPQVRSMPRSYHASAAFRRGIGAEISYSLDHRTLEYAESAASSSGELKRPAIAPLEREVAPTKQAATSHISAFSHLWGMIKNVTRPKDSSTASSQAVDGTPDAQTGPHRHPLHHQRCGPKTMKSSSSNRSLASINSNAASLSSKKHKRHHAADVSAVAPAFKPLPLGLDRRKSFHVIPIASAAKKLASTASTSQPHSNASAGSTVFGMSPTESMQSYPRGMYRRASVCAAGARSLGCS